MVFKHRLPSSGAGDAARSRERLNDVCLAETGGLAVLGGLRARLRLRLSRLSVRGYAET